jgi:hypothetical protein
MLQQTSTSKTLHTFQQILSLLEKGKNLVPSQLECVDIRGQNPTGICHCGAVQAKRQLSLMNILQTRNSSNGAFISLIDKVHKNYKIMEN